MGRRVVRFAGLCASAAAPLRWRRALVAVLASAGVLWAAGCAAERGAARRRATVHVVAPGETISGIAARYGTSTAVLVRLNGLSDPDRIWPGQRLRIGSVGAAVRPPRGPQPGSGASPQGWRWPVEGELSSGFGLRGLRRHRGIDITAPAGTPVRAAASGRVVHSGSARGGYGNLVIVRHGGDTSSVYAHNRRNLVRVGEWVEAGQPIAEVGQTGRASGPHLHFEVRRAGRAQNPLDFLP